MIKIENLRLEYNKRFNLFVDDLIIQKGEILTIIGPNGAGKTTLLNILAMFEKPESGSIEVFGNNILNGIDKLALRRQMSFVFSQAYLVNSSVSDNISLPLKLRGIHNAHNVKEMFEVFEIGHLRDSNASTLSQGEKHRVALARAFVTNPKLILLDEPFLSLDRRYKESLIETLRKIIKTRAITAIFVTQDQTEALSLADNMAVMKDGRILQLGKPDEIFTKPSSREVADFVGIETVVEGVIVKKEDNLCFVKVGDKFLEVISTYNQGDNVFVCIRPENVIIAPSQEKTSARNQIKAVITSIEPWRLKYKVNLDCGFSLSAYLTKQSVENLDLKFGQEVFVSFKATAIHLIRR